MLLLAVSLVWRPSHNPGPPVAESATVSAAPAGAQLGTVLKKEGLESLDQLLKSGK